MPPATDDEQGKGCPMTEEERQKVCFAVTPIGEEGSEIRRRSDQVLRHVITPIVAGLGYEVVRSDLISQPGMITHQIIDHLMDDDLVVADLTYGNPNVFYELAIRHATRKPAVSIMEAGTPPPFDVNQSRTIQFDHHDLDSVAWCKEELRRQVVALQENPSDFFTPVSVAIDLKAARDSGNPEARMEAQMLSTLQSLQADVSRLQATVRNVSGQVRNPNSMLDLTGSPSRIQQGDRTLRSMEFTATPFSALPEEHQKRIRDGTINRLRKIEETQGGE